MNETGKFVNKTSSEKVLLNNTNNSSDDSFNLTAELEKFLDKILSNSSYQEEQKKKEKDEEMKKKKYSEVEKISMEEQKKLNEERDKKEAERIKREKEKEEFDKQISNFTFSDLISFTLKAGNGELLYENITKKCKIRIAFIVYHPEQNIYFTFSGPLINGTKKQIVLARDKNFFYYDYEVQEPGVYTFFLNNFKNKQENTVTFGISYGVDEDKSLESRSMDKLSIKLNTIDNRINEMRIKENLIVKKTESHNQSVKKHNKSIMIFSFIEMFTMVLIFAIQMCYIKNLVDRF